jgi:hypothetical protein
MRWREWGCPDRRIDPHCITRCSSSQTSTSYRVAGVIQSCRQRAGSWYRSPLAITAQAILAILFAKATAAMREISDAAPYGRCIPPTFAIVWSTDRRPGPHAMMPIAIAAQVM